MIPRGAVLADVGTDHGYVPIYLVSNGIIPRAIAMDIGEGPLGRAREHIRERGLSSLIETRISDGVSALHPGEAGAILIAGMGGALIRRILSSGAEACRAAECIALQPQSEVSLVREFLAEEGYVTDEEKMVEEGGKYYPMMRARYAPGEGTAEADELAMLYGGMLLSSGDAALYSYLKKERRTLENVLGEVGQRARGERGREREAKVRDALAKNDRAMRRIESVMGSGG